MKNQTLKNNTKICEKCGSDKTYIRPNGRHEWSPTETGFLCKNCATQDYRSRKFTPKRRTPLKGPCVECGSEISYKEKSGYEHWYQGRDGTICKRCFNNQRERVMLPGQCVLCKTAYTRHGWTKTAKGRICIKCYKKNYNKIPRSGFCILCKRTSHVAWHKHPEYGRICGSCSHHLRNKAIKLETLLHYSKGKLSCNNCRYSKNINALELDHIQGGGNKSRKELNSEGGTNYMSKLKKRGFPEGYQVLCANCNKIKQIEEDPKNTI